jgi:hypothetical protein
MATVGKAALVVLVGVIGSMSILSYVSYAQTVSDLPQVLPAGEELPNEKLLEVEGEQAVSVIVGAGLGGLADLAEQGYKILRGRRERIDWSRVGAATAEGAAIGFIGYFLSPTIAKLDKLVNLWVKRTYSEAVTFVSTEVVSPARDFVFNKAIPAVSAFINDTLASAFSKAFHWIVDKIKR